MATSARIIRVLNDTYTLEIEVEVEAIDELAPELMKTDWGRKMAYLLSEMLPRVPEWKGKEEMEKMERERKQNEEKLKREGFREGVEKGKEEQAEKVKELEKKIDDLENKLEVYKDIERKVEDMMEWKKSREEEKKKEEAKIIEVEDNREPE